MAFSVFRGFVVLDCPLDACFTYVYQYEPYLKDPVGFPRVMMLVYLFYASPADCLHLWSENTWMQLDVGLDHLLSRGHGSVNQWWPYRSISALPHPPVTYRVPADKMVACYHPQCAAGCCAGLAGPR
ncbi:hypothetical protein FQN60_002456 [Etheostoma spectabile]|uniref:Uncharacterized protein n=1 Tax=Etheostoma spectabile TaxID=54343 RepID=A0A5J5C7L7_9PERO|nr:hypothetical protein FQN60_002456 [Etheostoma spectabile]